MPSPNRKHNLWGQTANCGMYGHKSSCNERNMLHTIVIQSEFHVIRPGALWHELSSIFGVRLRNWWEKLWIGVSSEICLGCCCIFTVFCTPCIFLAYLQRAVYMECTLDCYAITHIHILFCFSSPLCLSKLKILVKKYLALQTGFKELVPLIELYFVIF